MDSFPAIVSPSPVLPPGYVKRYDSLTGYDYYVNLRTGSSQWTFPRASAYLPNSLDHPGLLTDACNPNLVPPPHGYLHYYELPTHDEGLCSLNSSAWTRHTRPLTWHTPEPPPLQSQPSRQHYQQELQPRVQLHMSQYLDPKLWSCTTSSAQMYPQVSAWPHQVRPLQAQSLPPPQYQAQQPLHPATCQPRHSHPYGDTDNHEKPGPVGQSRLRSDSRVVNQRPTSSSHMPQGRHGQSPAIARPQSAEGRLNLREKRGFLGRHPGIAGFLTGGLAVFGLSRYLDSGGSDGDGKAFRRHSHQYEWPDHHGYDSGRDGGCFPC